MTRKQSTFTRLALLYQYVKLSTVTTLYWHTLIWCWSFPPPTFNPIRHFHTSSTCVPSPNPHSLLSLCLNFHQELPRWVPGEGASVTKCQHQIFTVVPLPTPRPGADVIEHFQRPLTRPQSPGLPPQRCRPLWPSSGWQLPARPAQCPGCSGWYRRWSSHTLSVQAPCPWKEQGSSKRFLRVQVPQLAAAMWAGGPCLLSTTLIATFQGWISDPCLGTPLCRAHAFLHLILLLTVFLVGRLWCYSSFPADDRHLLIKLFRCHWLKYRTPIIFIF